MDYIDLCFADAAANLACDEALLSFCENGAAEAVLRIWEPRTYFVVVGYSNKIGREVNVEHCRANGIPILRRFSGGGTVLQGPGCLNYTLIVPNDLLGASIDLVSSYKFVLERHRAMCQRLIGKSVEVAGISDLATAGKKFSGNAQHRKRRCTLFHGTFLRNFDLPLISKLLPLPSKQPEYRNGRDHGEFLCNLDVNAKAICDALQNEWQAQRPLSGLTEREIVGLARRRYSRDDWNEKF
jgi:lipoate-protein ligase A